MIAGNFDEFQTGVVNLAPCFVIWYWQHKAYTTPHLIPSLQRRGILKVVGSFIFNHVITDWLYQRRNWPWSTKWESFAMKRMHVLLSTINTFIKKELVLQTRQCWNSVWMASLQSIFMWLCVRSMQHKVFLGFTLFNSDSLLWTFEWQPLCCKFAIYFSLFLSENFRKILLSNLHCGSFEQTVHNY